LNSLEDELKLTPTKSKVKVIFIYGNARAYHVTAPTETTVKGALSRYFKKGDVPYLAAIEAGGVWLGTQRVRSVTDRVPAGALLRVYISPTQLVSYHLADEDIVAETKDYIVVVKPAGLSTVPDRACDRFNLTAAVGAYLKKKGIRYVPTAISRLDLMVQGIVVFPKHKDAERQLFAMMQGHRIRKLYRATIAIRRNESDGPSQYVSVNRPIDFGKKAFVTDQGKPSRTIFLRNLSSPDLVSAVPVTGRRHQIRIHAASTIGPIVGDTMYGGPSADRIYLSAVGLNFKWKRERIRIRYDGPFPDPLRMELGAITGPGVGRLFES